MTLNQIELLEKHIVEHQGYCEVPSATSHNTYRVYFNSKLYSVSCNCKAGQCHQDCGHRIAVDRHFDDRRKAPKPVVVVDQHPELDTCDTCGAFVKKGFTTCAKCLGF